MAPASALLCAASPRTLGLTRRAPLRSGSYQRLRPESEDALGLGGGRGYAHADAHEDHAVGDHRAAADRPPGLEGEERRPGAHVTRPEKAEVVAGEDQPVR